MFPFILSSLAISIVSSSVLLLLLALDLVNSSRSSSLGKPEPRFSFSREPVFGVPLIEGMTVLLKCDIDADPPSEPKWVRDIIDINGVRQTRPVRTGPRGQLVFPSITMSDSGWYRCTTDHQSGHFSSLGYFLSVQNASIVSMEKAFKSPILPPLSLDNIVNRGAHNVHSNYRQTSSTQSGHPMINPGPDNQPYPSELDPNRRKDDPSPSECNNNFDGRPIIIAYNRTIIAIVGKPITFYAQFCCEPKPNKVFWIHRHLCMVPGRTIGPYASDNLSMAGNSRNCYQSTFSIDTTKPDDEGEVTFIVGNSKGLTDIALSLNVTRAGYSISQGDRSNSRNILLVTFMILLFKAFFGS
ncbi:irregular chiasm C-roughest protein teiresias [Brevipalpus obovatus]|uniref:irregular chiasm C-roughest protein teiresias n=1 Tax=Brevipalpus obovatus TaxID=246614 RepID=UPI003D9F7738